MCYSMFHGVCQEPKMQKRRGGKEGTPPRLMRQEHPFI